MVPALRIQINKCGSFSQWPFKQERSKYANKLLRKSQWRDGLVTTCAEKREGPALRESEVGSFIDKNLQLLLRERAGVHQRPVAKGHQALAKVRGCGIAWWSDI